MAAADISADAATGAWVAIYELLGASLRPASFRSYQALLTPLRSVAGHPSPSRSAAAAIDSSSVWCNHATGPQALPDRGALDTARDRKLADRLARRCSAADRPDEGFACLACLDWGIRSDGEQGNGFRRGRGRLLACRRNRSEVDFDRFASSWREADHIAAAAKVRSAALDKTSRYQILEQRLHRLE